MQRSVADAVVELLARDGITREGLARGIVNKRALARWILAQQGWDASEEAVLSALRRHAETRSPGTLEQARKAFGQGHVNITSRVCMVVCTKSPGVQQRLAPLFGADVGLASQALRILQTARVMKVTATEADLSSVVDRLPEEVIEQVHRELSEIRVELPLETQGIPGMLSLLCMTLGARGINVLEVATAPTELIVLVDARDVLPAHEALQSLVQPERWGGIQPERRARQRLRPRSPRPARRPRGSRDHPPWGCKLPGLGSRPPGHPRARGI